MTRTRTRMATASSSTKIVCLTRASAIGCERHLLPGPERQVRQMWSGYGLRRDFDRAVGVLTRLHAVQEIGDVAFDRYRSLLLVCRSRSLFPRLGVHHIPIVVEDHGRFVALECDGPPVLVRVVVVQRPGSHEVRKF